MYAVSNILSLLIISLVSILCLMLFARADGNRPLRAFRHFLISIVLWLLSNYALKIVDSSTVLLFSLKMTFATSALMIYCLYRFSEAFPNEIRPRNIVFDRLAASATGLVMVLSFTDSLVRGFTTEDSLVLAQYGGAFYVYLVYVTLMFGMILHFFRNQYRVSSPVKKQQSKFLFIGVILSMVFISSIDLVIPMLSGSNTSANFGPYGIVFLVVFAFLALTRHHLFEMKVIVSEFWAAFLVIAIFAWLTIHFSIGNLIGFLLIFSVCVLFIRAVISEAGKENKLVEANHQLERDKKELVELDRLKDEFLQMATHELNTPITAIQGRMDMGIRENMCKLNNKQKAFFQPILDQTTRLARLSRDVLDTARIDQHRLAINASETDLDALISQIVSSLEPKAKDRGNSIAYIPLSKSLPKLNVDQSKISQVITNLIDNAIKFTENGQIAVTSKLKGDKAIISVADTGIGIDEKDRKHLFEKFYQAGRFDPDDPQEQQGSGLGLYISQNIIKLHGGTMWLESAKSKGSTFYFSLPLEHQVVKQSAMIHSDGSGLRVL